MEIRFWTQCDIPADPMAFLGAPNEPKIHKTNRIVSHSQIVFKDTNFHVLRRVRVLLFLVVRCADTLIPDEHPWISVFIGLVSFGIGLGPKAPRAIIPERATSSEGH